MAAAFLDVQACAARAVFRSASDRGGAQKGAQVPRQAAFCPGPAVADAWVAPDAVRWDVRAKCRAAVRDSLLAEGHDFHLAEGACLAVAMHRDVLERSPAPRPQAASQMAVYSAALRKAVHSLGPQLRAEPVRLPVVKLELQDEWVLVRQPERASPQLERLPVPVLAPSEQFSEPQAKQSEEFPGEVLGPLV